MKGQFRWRCHHVLKADEGLEYPCNQVNVVLLDTSEPEGKALVCASCGTPAGAEALVRNSGA